MMRVRRGGCTGITKAKRRAIGPNNKAAAA
jgi:hypothetical protein